MQEIALSILLILSEIESREELRFEHSTEQGFDTSCGLSTLACFLDLYWKESADELALASEYLASKIASGDYTVSFTDIKRILEAKGFKVAAYKMSYEQLEKAVTKYAPLIVHYDEPEGHFALVLGIDELRVVTADPSEGTVERDKRDFESMWSGNVTLAVRQGKAADRSMMNEAITISSGRRELAESSLFPSFAGASW